MGKAPPAPCDRLEFKPNLARATCISREAGNLSFYVKYSNFKILTLFKNTDGYILAYPLVCGL